MELKITAPAIKPIEIENYTELKEEITALSKHYAGMVYTDATIKDAKADRAKLNKFAGALNDARIEYKKKCLEPYEAFEMDIKGLIKIVNEPIALIGEQINAFDERQKREKMAEIESYFDGVTKPEFVTLDKIFDPKWLNKSVTLKNIKDQIVEIINGIYADVATLETLDEFAFEALDDYSKHLDLGHAIAEGKRLAEIQQRKQIERAKEILKADEKPVEVEPEQIKREPVIEEEKILFKFTALLNKTQAQALAEFFTANEIEYKFEV